MDLKDRIAIVSGASSGIGLALARQLTDRGAQVALAARSKDKLVSLTAELPDSFAIAADMSDAGQIDKLIKAAHDHYGQIDILVNNAGRGYDATIQDTDIAQLNQIIGLDLIGPLVAMQAVVPIMEAQGRGTIVNVSSGTALMHLPNMGGYAAVKAALAHLSLTAREELKDRGITVSVVYPYLTDTEFEANTFKGKIDPGLFERGGSVLRDPDTAEYAADLIIRAIETGTAQVVAHDLMK